MSPAIIFAAATALVFFGFLVLHVITWVKGNDQPVKWHVGRVFIDLLGLVAAGAIFAFGS